MTMEPLVNIYPELSGAGIAQLAECQLPKLNVAGSTPVARSKPSFIPIWEQYT